VSESETAKTDDAGFVARPLCPFCSKPFGDDMIEAWAESWGCESGGYDTEACVGNYPVDVPNPKG
jgi:hypothetical protein